MRYEWDENKNRMNLTDHGIGFEAIERFEWATAVKNIDAREDYGELRDVAIGFIGERLHYLVYVSDDDENCIRLISLRRATQREKRRYVDARK